LVAEGKKSIKEAIMRRKIPNWILPVLCASFLLVFALALMLTPQKEYSAEENRALTTAPRLTAASLLDGSYTRTLGDYFADQFPLRAGFVRLKARCEQLFFGQENNGVIFGKDDYLIPRQEYTEAEYAVLDRNLAAAQQLAQALADNAATAQIPTVFAPVPRSIDVNRSKLPRRYDPQQSDAVWEHLQNASLVQAQGYVDFRVPLIEAAERGEQVWFRTDHHWTTEGAYLAYVALGEVLGYTPYDRADFTPEAVSDQFLGTTYSKAGLIAAQPDAIALWRYDTDSDYTTEIWENGSPVTTIGGFYDTAALDGKDQYSVFLGGTRAHIRVLPPENADLPTLLVIKDSYAQSLAPFLSRHYKLILIDPRSYRPTANQPSVLALIEQECPDAVLLLCGIDTLCGDVDLRTLLVGK
jgi:hypothetical protein